MDEIKSVWYSEYQKAVCWGNTCSIVSSESMRNQLFCHMNLVGAFKGNWNLEPWRRNEAWYNLQMLTLKNKWVFGGWGWQCNPPAR